MEFFSIKTIIIIVLLRIYTRTSTSCHLNGTYWQSFQHNKLVYFLLHWSAILYSWTQFYCMVLDKKYRNFLRKGIYICYGILLSWSRASAAQQWCIVPRLCNRSVASTGMLNCQCNGLVYMCALHPYFDISYLNTWARESKCYQVQPFFFLQL